MLLVRSCSVCLTKYSLNYFMGKDIRCQECTHNHKYIKYDVEVDRVLKNRTRYQTKKLVDSGKIPKRCCEVCGESKVECHHIDYTRPDKVVWLCVKHHALWHTRQRKFCWIIASTGMKFANAPHTVEIKSGDCIITLTHSRTLWCPANAAFERANYVTC